MLYPKPLRGLIVLLAKLPGVGEKTATRLAFHMLKMTPESVRELGESIAAVPNAVIHCSRCFNIADQDPCTICADPAGRVQPPWRCLKRGGAVARECTRVGGWGGTPS